MTSALIFAQSNQSLSVLRSSTVINNLQENSRAVTDSLNYDASNDGNSIGTNAADEFGAYAFFPRTMINQHSTAGSYILSVKIYIAGADIVTSSALRIYTTVPGVTPIYNQAFTPVEGWNEVVLSTPLAIPATGDLTIGYYLVVTGGYPLGCDEGPANPNANWMDYEGEWVHLTDLAPTLTYNWNIRAMVGSSTSVSEATSLDWSVYPNPADKDVTIQTNENTLVTICDLLGRTVYSSQINGTTTISVEAFKAGVYIVKSENNGTVQTTKLIVR